VPEVDVEEMSIVCDHYIAIMPVPDAHHVRGYTIPSARTREVVLGQR
jgi:hypothetical protein